MKKIALILAVVIVSSLGSPFASAAFAKEKSSTEPTVCVCPPDCSHTMDKKCKHKCHKKNHECEHEE